MDEKDFCLITRLLHLNLQWWIFMDNTKILLITDVLMVWNLETRIIRWFLISLRIAVCFSGATSPFACISLLRRDRSLVIGYCKLKDLIVFFSIVLRRFSSSFIRLISYFACFLYLFLLFSIIPSSKKFFNNRTDWLLNIDRCKITQIFREFCPWHSIAFSQLLSIIFKGKNKVGF